ncbi:VOC family protein [Parasphingopyxis marina]|uniref:VOC family protein n=1 Tax=Parasphingopyxis marina TaxID=2761622 RepID=A0A842I1H7_9SPHN|nr:VOC family protein [Parasphingopyxis marina]MBC2779102.1 VOC family protein [Parasphingopyxis marina]
MPKSCIPFLMFTGEAKAALDFYLATFAGAKLEAIEQYGEGERMPPSAVKMAVFSVAGQQIRVFDSPPVHGFTFTPSQSFFVECSSEEELRGLSETLSHDGKVMMPTGNYGFSRLYAWVADRFGVPWQLNLA